MSDQVLPTSNVANNYLSPPASPSIGATVDMGPTQGATERQFSLSGGTSADVVDVHSSQDGISWNHVCRLKGGPGGDGDSEVVPGIARYLRTIRQAGTVPVSCQVGDLVPPSAASPGSYWDAGGNATGPLTGGTEDGSGVAIGAGLAGGVIPTAGAGTFFVNAQTALALALAGVNQFIAGAGGVQIGNSGAIGVSLGAGVAPTNTSNTVNIDAFASVLLGTAAAVTVAMGNYANTTNAAVLVGAGVLSLLYSTAGGGQVNMGSQGATFPTLANSIQLRTHGNGSVTAAADGTGSASVVGGSGGVSVDAPGPATFGATNATSVTVGNSAAPHAVRGSNVQMGNVTGSYGGGLGVYFFGNGTTAPTTNPTGGGILYVTGGALLWRGSSGAITTIAPA